MNKMLITLTTVSLLSFSGMALAQSTSPTTESGQMTAQVTDDDNDFDMGWLGLLGLIGLAGLTGRKRTDTGSTSIR